MPALYTHIITSNKLRLYNGQACNCLKLSTLLQQKRDGNLKIPLERKAGVRNLCAVNVNDHENKRDEQVFADVQGMRPMKKQHGEHTAQSDCDHRQPKSLWRCWTFIARVKLIAVPFMSPFLRSVFAC